MNIKKSLFLKRYIHKKETHAVRFDFNFYIQLKTKILKLLYFVTNE